jgi:CRISPR-associated protein Cas1
MPQRPAVGRLASADLQRCNDPLHIGAAGHPPGAAAAGVVDHMTQSDFLVFHEEPFELTGAVDPGRLLHALAAAGAPYLQPRHLRDDRWYHPRRVAAAVMDSVIVSDPGVFLGRTSERLVVRGPRPQIDLVDGGKQLILPLDIRPTRHKLSVTTSSGAKTPPPPLRRPSRDTARAEQLELPLFRISEIIVSSHGVSISTDLIEACCERGIRIAFLSSTGRPLAMVSSPMLTATVLTRREQMAAYGDARGLAVATAVVRGKLTNQGAVLKYFGKYQKAADLPAYALIEAAVRGISGLRGGVASVGGTSVDEARAGLLAIEGSAGRHYWSAVRVLLGERGAFDAREHRGAADPVNSALNYGYGILYTQVWGAVMNAGLEPFAGFLHVDRPGKPSLVLDLIEEFRQPIVDRAVIALVTKGPGIEVKGGLLTDASRRTVAAAVLERLESEVMFRGRRYHLKSVVQMQARNLASFLRGGPPYRPFAFKW